MGSITREPITPGPVSDFFAKIDDLHVKAGRPSVRDIARRAGRGNISPSNVHTILSGSRVPAWDFVEKIIRALKAETQREELFSLWDAAWLQQHSLKPEQHSVKPKISKITSAFFAGMRFGGFTVTGVDETPVCVWCNACDSGSPVFGEDDSLIDLIMWAENHECRWVHGK